MLLTQVALVPEISEISASELTRVSAALQKQALRDPAGLRARPAPRERQLLTANGFP